MTELEQLTARIIEFRDARDWKQFHNPKDLALSLVLEATELLEIFQWKQGTDIDRIAVERRKEIGDELADVLYWVLLISHDLRIDLQQALDAKMAANEAKYPVEKARGTSAKYTDLDL